MSFVEERTSRNLSERDSDAIERYSHELPPDYDEKDDLSALRDKLKARKKPIFAGLGFLCIVLIGTVIAVSSGGSTDANTQSAYDQAKQETPVESSAPPETEPTQVEIATVAPPSEVVQAGSAANESASFALQKPDQDAKQNESTTPTPTTDGPQLPYKALDFDWKNKGLWERADGAGVDGSIFSDNGIKLTPANSAQPIRTKQGWNGEKIILIEWENSPSSDTNIWMLNTKLQNQFGVGNGWPYWGEIDIFEMFTQDARDKSAYDFSGHGAGVGDYGQLTLHMGPAAPAMPCFCKAAPSKSAWYQGAAPMSSSCTAQFSNDRKNAIATVWGSDGGGKYLQLWQHPTVTKGGKTADGKQTYDIQPGGTTTQKIYSNGGSFWGANVDSCASAGGHNPSSGFPFFESFRIILEEQKKGDGGAWFQVTNIQVFNK